MKTAYELAMERLGKSSPSIKLTQKQKERLAEADSFYTAKIAERELALKSEIAQAEAKADFDTIEKLTARLNEERRALLAEREEKKEKIRRDKS
jgi:hypothetical protein